QWRVEQPHQWQRVEDSKPGANRCLAGLEWIPYETDARRNVGYRRISIEYWTADFRARIGQIVEKGNLAVDLGWYGEEFITHTNVERQIRPVANIVLDVAGDQ